MTSDSSTLWFVALRGTSPARIAAKVKFEKRSVSCRTRVSKKPQSSAGLPHGPSACPSWPPMLATLEACGWPPEVGSWLMPTRASPRPSQTRPM